MSTTYGERKMAKHVCPQCGSEKATMIMLPRSAGSSSARMDPAYRCLECDTQWRVRDALALARDAGTEDDGVGAGPSTSSDGG